MGLTLKQRVKKSIDSLPDDATLEDITEHILFMYRIEKGIEQFENRDFILDDEVLERIQQR